MMITKAATSNAAFMFPDLGLRVLRFMGDDVALNGIPKLVYRRIVWSRRAPTETIDTGTPDNFAIASMYF